jgi:hypothetical protein
MSKKQIIGRIIVTTFNLTGALIWAYCTYRCGWYFIFSMVAVLTIGGIGLLGHKLLNSKK